MPLREAEKNPLNLLWLKPAKGVSVLEFVLSIVLGVYLQVSNPLLPYKVATYGIKLVPMAAGIALQVVLKEKVDVKKHPYLHDFLSKFMTACNTVLALPAVTPITSTLEKTLYTYMPQLTTENGAEHKAIQSYLESSWEKSVKSYSTQARSSRYVLHEALEIVASALRTAKEDKTLRPKALADLAIRLRLLFSEFSAKDIHITRTANLYFPLEDMEMIDAAILKRDVFKNIAMHDPEFQDSEANNYYHTLLDSWLGKDANIYLVVGLGDIEKEMSLVPKYLEAGISRLQLDARKLETSKALELAYTLRNLTQEYAIPFYINSDVNLAVQRKADGVHFMQVFLEQIREARDANLAVGLSIQGSEDVDTFEDYVEYYSLGPIFHSRTYPEVKVKGLESLKILSLNSKKPIYAAGGIRSHTMNKVFEHGAYGIVKRVR